MKTLAKHFGVTVGP